jgi:glycosyltransferase involved in cell wall biosynthesis
MSDSYVVAGSDDLRPTPCGVAAVTSSTVASDAQPLSPTSAETNKPHHSRSATWELDDTGRNDGHGDDPPRASDYVCFAGQDWWYHNHAHSDFQLMRRVAERRQVLFVNSIGMRMPLPGRSTQPLRRLARKLGSLARFARRPDPQRPGFIVYSPFIVPFYSSSTMRKINATIIRWQVRVLVRWFGLHQPTYFVTLPTAWDVVKGLSPHAVIYNRSDKQSAFPEVDREAIESLENELLRHADAAVYVSHALMDADAPLVGERSVFLDHGVDLDHFSTTSEPSELNDIPHPRIGFFGSFDDYTVDFDLLDKLAAAIPNASIVLIGSSTEQMQRLTRHKNVYWLGYRPYEQIPAYGSGFDVAMMPWLRNEWIRYCNPIKLKEYLALGLPIVSMPFPEAARYEGVINIATDHAEFIAIARTLLANGSTAAEHDRRRDVVRADSWDQRADDLLRLSDALGD